MTPDRMFFFFRLFLTAFLETLEGATGGAGDAGEETVRPRRSILPPVINMKPERIQFWLRQLGELLIEVADGMTVETGESVDSADGSAETVDE